MLAAFVFLLAGLLVIAIPVYIVADLVGNFGFGFGPHWLINKALMLVDTVSISDVAPYVLVALAITFVLAFIDGRKDAYIQEEVE